MKMYSYKYFYKDICNTWKPNYIKNVPIPFHNVATRVYIFAFKMFKSIYIFHRFTQQIYKKETIITSS